MRILILCDRPIGKGPATTWSSVAK